MKKRLMVGLLAGGLLAAMLPGVASAASVKGDLYGNWSISCSDGTGHWTKPLDDGFVRFNFTKSMVSALIVVKGVKPNTSHDVRLKQGPADCLVIDGVLTTNVRGDGTLWLREPRTGTFATITIWEQGPMGPGVASTPSVLAP